MPSTSDKPLVGVIMGSASDLAVMGAASALLEELEIPREVRIISAHRTPEATFEYAATAEDRGLEVLIAGAGAAAALPGVIAAKTLLPVVGVPLAATPLNGFDALMSIVQMPKGVPVGTMAVGKAGAANAALFAAAIIARKDTAVATRLRAWRDKRKQDALANQVP